MQAIDVTTEVLQMSNSRLTELMFNFYFNTHFQAF